jgi:hypothetical protein
MSRTVPPVSSKPYGLVAVCHVWRLARSSVYRHQGSAVQRDTPTPWADGADIRR